MQRIGITVTGFPGSGSTTLGKLMAEKLGWPPPYYSGGVVRWLTVLIEEHGIEAVRKMTPQQVVDAMETGIIPLQPQISEAYRKFPKHLDRFVDGVQLALLEKKDVGIHEGRVAWFLAKFLCKQGRASDKTFIHICCIVNPVIGAKRQLRRPENINKTLEQVIKETEDRLLWEGQRYRELYQIADHLAAENFDILLDTTFEGQEDVRRRAFDEIERLRPGLLREHLKK